MERASIKQIWGWLDMVPDPEIPEISVVDLGVIRHVVWDDDRLIVTVTPTYSGCPASAVINLDIHAALHSRGVEKIFLKRQLAPAWTTDWLTQKGRKKLEEIGIAPPQHEGRPRRCPRCGGDDLECISPFGSTPCKASWRCTSCLEPFDYFKCI